MAVRFRPEDGIVGDLIPFYDTKRQQYHAFYLKADGNHSRWPRWQTTWGHVVSTDLVEWKELPDALERGLRTEPDGGACSTGSVIDLDGVYHAFYFGLNPGKSWGMGQLLGSPGLPGGREQIMHATSLDCITFKKDKGLVDLKPDDKTYLFGDDWRDPRVFWNDEDSCFYITITANLKSAACSARKGVVALARSTNLQQWKLLDPIYSPNTAPSLECTDVFRINKTWYMIFSQFGGFTEYRYAKSLYGPWERPTNPILDGGASFFYAGRTLFDGKRRLLFGWCGTLYQDRDSDFGQWGGDLVTPRELVQLRNDELAARCPEEIARCGAKANTRLGRVWGDWDTASTGNTLCRKREGFSAALFEGELAEAKLSLRMTSAEKRGKAGILVRCAEDTSECYCVSVDFGLDVAELVRYKIGQKKNDCLPELTMCLARQHLGNEWGQGGHWSLELLIILKSNVVEIFVDNRVTITARIEEIKGKRLGLFCEDAQVQFDKIDVARL